MLPLFLTLALDSTPAPPFGLVAPLELAARTGLTFANASRHLQILRRTRLAEPRREGKRMLYSLAGDEEVVSLLHALGRVGERNTAEIERVMATYFRARDEMEPVSRASLIARMQDGLVTVLDVRPEEEFALGHLPGALNVPLRTLERQLATLPKNQEIVAYCREELAPFKVPKIVEFRPKLPKSLIGKVLRRSLREEELTPRTTQVQTGQVSVSKNVVSEERTMDVPVTREEAFVQRTPVERRPSDRPIDATSERTIDMQVQEERVTLDKQPVVYEEVGIGKHNVTDTTQVSGTVRREEVRIEHEGDVTTPRTDLP